MPVGSDHLISVLQVAMLRHRETLLAYISRQLPVSLARIVEPTDILQDVCIDAFVACGDWMTEEDDAIILRGLKTIARHKIVDTLRWYQAAKRGGGNVVGVGDFASRSTELLIEQLVLYERTPSASAMSHEAHLLVRKTIDSLGEDQAKALHLRYLAGMSLKDVGDQMSRTQNAAGELCRRALHELRRRLTPAG